MQYSIQQAHNILYNRLTERIRLVRCHTTFIAFSQLSSMVFDLLNGTARICHLSTKEIHIATTHKLQIFCTYRF
jgi:hypothetical protein